MAEEVQLQMQGDVQGQGSSEEKIFVSVRIRPLNDKEIWRNDVSDWECINTNTVVFKDSLPERSMFPVVYTFDRVFGHGCPTKEVYLEGAKEIVLSVLNGINSTIFAYGQTSSGKTYTMQGITEYAVADIYDYIEKHQEREFVLKFSAMEIYNEAVRDLLSLDSTPLRLLDDPERGTVVERLIEEILRDKEHLEELLSICEAQRQIGETSLNETSSRSHQILRLTVESSARDYSGAGNSSTLTATVNFVDLAGSERASQTLPAGTRLKEGCHINRSLLTLGTVIRKLSKGRNGQHVPYRDSKLTRILQNSLGGNGRTAIICTMSPALSHVEQSRNTLLFASCAKEVSTNAQVNLVMSDKALVKQLQRELAMLESEMKRIGSGSGRGDSATLLKEKEIQIEQMAREIEELTRQRDLAQSKIENLIRSDEGVQTPKQNYYLATKPQNFANPQHVAAFNKLGSFNGPNTPSYNQWLEHSENPDDNFLLDDSTPRFTGLDPCQGWEEIARKTEEESEDFCKDVRCIEIERSIKRNTGEANDDSLTEIEETKVKPDVSSFIAGDNEGKLAMPEDIIVKTEADDFLQEKEKLGTMAMIEDSAPFSQKDTPSHPMNAAETCYALRQKIQELQGTIDYLISVQDVEHSPIHSDTSGSSSWGTSGSRSCSTVLNTPASSLPGTPPTGFERNFPGRPFSGLKYDFPNIPRRDTLSCGSFDAQTLECFDVEDIMSNHGFVPVGPELNGRAKFQLGNQLGHDPDRRRNFSLDFAGGGKLTLQSNKQSDEDMKKQLGDDSVRKRTSVSLDFVPGMRKMDPQSEKQSGDVLVQESAANADESVENIKDTKEPPTPSEFEMQQRKIIELWDACHVPLIHRTYFFLLFKGDPSDAVYMEVELRRLSFLKNSLPPGTNVRNDSHSFTTTSSMKDLKRERAMLSRQVQKKFSRKEREELYKSWGIVLNTKQRALQLGRRLWTDAKDIEHIKKSAFLVAKLIGFVEPSQAPKEVFGLSFLPRNVTWRSYTWN
ncbi:hypothetical protein SLA2020_308860 [Shorea laevis]